ncbi:MAG TPA: hypothetical protein VGX78_17050, partial [Pirellulales bacterium]|nr:hypothetical protein [Pirellulales bacterium]
MDRDTLTLAEFNAAKAAHRQTARAAGALDEGSARPQKAPVRADLPTLRYGGKTFAEWEQELLTELEPASRIQAIEAIRAFGLNGNAHEAIRAISHVVSASEDSTVFDAACQTLQAFGPPSVPILIEGFTQNKKHRGSAAGALGQIGPEAIEALPVLFEAGREGNDPAPPSLGYALANIALGDEASARMLAEAIEHAQSTVRGGIVNALAFTAATQPDRVVPLLLLALRDRKIDIRRVAALALATHAPSEQVVVDGLKRAIHDQT